jgi:hypothetical protein
LGAAETLLMAAIEAMTAADKNSRVRVRFKDWTKAA